MPRAHLLLPVVVLLVAVLAVVGIAARIARAELISVADVKVVRFVGRKGAAHPATTAAECVALFRPGLCADIR